MGYESHNKSKHADKPTLRFGLPVLLALAGSALGLFGWFGAIRPWPQAGSRTDNVGISPRPSESVARLAAQSGSGVGKSLVFTVRGCPPKPGSLLTCYSKVRVHSPLRWRCFQSQCIGVGRCQGSGACRQVVSQGLVFFVTPS